jgi:glutamate-1-semialdehyde aminotransferase
LFGVQADLVTYGTCIGVGMPIGVLAGSAEYMDAIDGGAWSFGDDSYPRAQTTVFRGTFFKHPLTMAACGAVLRHLRDRGPALQEDLTRRTEQLCAALDEGFARRGLPMRMVHFASLFLFNFEDASPIERELFFQQLLAEGVYVWEGRTCYLSTAHTERDLEELIAAVGRAGEALQRGGFLSGTRSTGRGPTTVPMSEGQRELWARASFSDDASRSLPGRGFRSLGVGRRVHHSGGASRVTAGERRRRR